MKEDYVCGNCNEVCTTTWTDEEARAEAEANGFGNVEENGLTKVCDDCYQLVMHGHNVKLD